MWALAPHLFSVNDETGFILSQPGAPMHAALACQIDELNELGITLAVTKRLAYTGLCFVTLTMEVRYDSAVASEWFMRGASRGGDA